MAISSFSIVASDLYQAAAWEGYARSLVGSTLNIFQSRFSQIYINHPVIKNNYINIHQFICNEKRKNYSLLKNKLDINNNNNYLDINDLIEISDYLFKKAITGIDLINYIIKYKYESKEKYRILLLLNKYKIYYRNEKLLIMYILYQIYFSLQIE